MENKRPPTLVSPEQPYTMTSRFRHPTNQRDTLPTMLLIGHSTQPLDPESSVFTSHHMLQSVNEPRYPSTAVLANPDHHTTVHLDHCPYPACLPGKVYRFL